MANTTDFISAVYDELAKQLQISASNPSIVMQMAWPGYALSPADFRRADSPNGPYDPDVAKEVFSALANIAPLLDRTRFENSGFEIDDLYEIVLSSAIPTGATLDTMTTNPIFRLFSDAQYEFQTARRGTHDDPGQFYAPCSATPSNWYDEAAPVWTTITLQQSDVKPANPTTSPFAKMGGTELVKQEMWKLRSDKSVLTQKLEKAMKPPISPTLSKAIRPQAIDPALLKKSAIPKPGMQPAVQPAVQPPLQKMSPLARGGVVPLEKLNPAMLETLAKNRFAQAVGPTNVFAKAPLDLSRLDLMRRDLGIQQLADRLRLQKLLQEQLPTKPPSPATDGFSVSFKFCRVNIDRPWLKLALLNTPNWWMFATPAGTYSTGTVDNNAGMFPLLTTSLIAIRDLKITANWSAEDRANIGNAAAFGFFDVRDGTFNSNTLEVKGLQVIGWISKVMPKLPPLGPQ